MHSSNLWMSLKCVCVFVCVAQDRKTLPGGNVLKKMGRQKLNVVFPCWPVNLLSSPPKHTHWRWELLLVVDTNIQKKEVTMQPYILVVYRSLSQTHDCEFNRCEKLICWRHRKLQHLNIKINFRKTLRKAFENYEIVKIQEQTIIVYVYGRAHLWSFTKAVWCCGLYPGFN